MDTEHTNKKRTINGNFNQKSEVSNHLNGNVIPYLTSLMIGNGPYTRETEVFRTDMGLNHPTFDNNQKHVSDIANEKVFTN